MSTFVQGGMFTVNALGPLVVTGLGFSPKAILFHSGGAGLVDTIADSSFGTIGMTDGVLTYSHAWAKEDLSRDNYSLLSSTALVRIDPTGATQTSISVASLDADGFTLSVDVLGIQGSTIITFTAFGGDTLQAKIGSFDAQGSVGAQVVAGVGFEPSLVFLSNSNAVFDAVQTNYAQGNLGITIKDTKTGVINAGVSSFRTWDFSIARSLQIPASTCNVANAIEQSGLINTMGPDGFTIDWTVAGLARPIQYLCLSGFEDLHLRQNTTAAGAGQSYTGVGFQPDSVFFTSCGYAPNGAPTIGAKLATGWSNAVSHATSGNSCLDGTEDFVNSVVSITRSLWTISGTITTLDFDVTSLDADGYTIVNNIAAEGPAHYALSIRNAAAVADKAAALFMAGD